MRTVVLGIALVFIVGFAFLTVVAATEQGVTVASVHLGVHPRPARGWDRRRAAQSSRAMSTSPFMTPDQSRLRRQQAARRRRQRRIAGVLLRRRPLPRRRRRGRAQRPLLRITAATRSAAVAGTAALSGAAKPPGPALSPAGLALAPPALKLAGIQTPSADPIQLRFRHPPRAGLLFNLDTGQVLWQRNAYRRVRIASLTKMMTALLTVALLAAERPRARHEGRRQRGRLEGRRAAAAQARAAGDDALRADAALGQRRRDRARPARLGQRQGLRAAHERRSGAARDGLHALLLAVGLRRRRQLLLRRRPRRARPRRPRPAPHRARRAHALRRRCPSRSRAASSTSTTTTRC